MQLSNKWAVVLSFGASVNWLQGCGSSSEPDDAGTTSASAETDPPTTTTPAERNPATDTPPMSAEDAAKYFNEMYMGYKVGDPTSNVGVVMRTTNKWEFFCEGFETFTGCYLGQAKCISSASILNNQVMVEKKKIVFALDRASGILFNTSMVETELGRCSYQFDGVSYGRYYRGCGSMAKNGDEKYCKLDASAWKNICPSTKKECTSDDAEVKQDYCETRIDNGEEPKVPIDGPCFWKGPAYSGDGASETHKMLDQRIKHQGKDANMTATWDEVVIDAALLLNAIKRDPATAIPAMVWRKSADLVDNKVQHAAAVELAAAMQKEFEMAAPVPVIGVDISVDVTKKGPFISEAPPGADQLV